MSVIAYKTKQSFLDLFKPIKWGFVIFASFILVGFILGMIYGFSNLSHISACDTSIEKLMTGNLGSLTSLIYRFLSLVLILIILCLLSKSKWLMPIALILVFYRAYLLGINIAILLSCYGLSGIIMALIYLPIDLCLIFVLVFCYLSLLRSCENYFKSKKQFLLICVLLLLIGNVLLFLFLTLFSPSIIFVL